MTTISRTFTVTPPPERVLAYLEDFSHAEEWDPGTDSCTRVDDGPVRVGSRWHHVSTIAGRTTELTYTLRERTDEKVVLHGENDTATTRGTITVLPHGAGRQRHRGGHDQGPRPPLTGRPGPRSYRSEYVASDTPT